MTDLKQLARQIFHETLAGVDIPSTFARKVSRDDSRLSIEDITVELAVYRSIRAVAMGKASVAMARGLVERLAPDVRIEGVLAAPHDDLAEVLRAHPRGADHALVHLRDVALPGRRSRPGVGPVDHEGFFCSSGALRLSGVFPGSLASRVCAFWLLLHCGAPLAK